MARAQFNKQTLGTNAAAADCVRVLNVMNANLADLFGGIASQPQSGSILLQSISLASGSNQIAHTLGRTLTGWTLTRCRANATVYDAQDSQPLPSTYLTLVASAPAVVDILVF
jgi:hypothetical protein